MMPGLRLPTHQAFPHYSWHASSFSKPWAEWPSSLLAAGLPTWVTSLMRRRDYSSQPQPAARAVPVPALGHTGRPFLPVSLQSRRGSGGWQRAGGIWRVPWVHPRGTAVPFPWEVRPQWGISESESPLCLTARDLALPAQHFDG